MKYLRIENAIEEFIGYAKIQGLASNEITNHKIANLAYDNIEKAFQYLKSEKAFEKMKVLLINDNVSVRLWGARYLLNVYEEESLKVLEEIANGNIYALSAEMTIKEWKKGNLTF